MGTEPIIRSKGDKGDSFYEFEFRVIKVFHMKNFYKFMYMWFQEEGYRAVNPDSMVDEYPEVYYEEWRLPDGEFQRRIWWRFMFNPETHSKPTSRYRYFIDVNFKNLYMKNVESVINGRKVKAQEGEVEVGVKAYVWIDTESVVANPFLKTFGYFFKKRWIKHTKEGYRDEIRWRMRRLQDAMKEFFNIVTYEDNQKNFHLERGL